MNAMKALLYIVLLVISPDIFAGIFDPPPTDKSLSLLGMIFGPNIGNVYLGGTANPTLSAIMEKFNFIIVVAGTIVVSYVGIMSTINTAQEGTAMGKKWSAVWIPMRSIAGMSLMIPSPASGYSMIQVTVIWIVVQGIGAADQLWNIALNGLASGVSAAAGTANYFAGMGDMRVPGQQLAQNVLEAAICMETLYQAAKSQANQTGNAGGPNWLAENGTFIKNFTDSPTEIVKNDSNGNKFVELKGNSFFGVEDPNQPEHFDVCGKIEVSVLIRANELEFTDENKVVQKADQNELLKSAQLAYDTKLLAISTMLSILRPLAQGLVIQSAPPHSTFPNEPEFESPVNDNPGYAVAAVNAYESLMSSLIIPDKGNTDRLTQAVIKAGKDNGWIVAGSFYFILNKTLTSTIFRTARDSISHPSEYEIDCKSDIANTFSDDIAAVDCSLKTDSPAFKNLASAGFSQASEVKELAVYLARGRNYLESDTVAPESTYSAFGETSSLPKEIGKLMGPANSAGASAIQSMMNIMGDDSGKDPLLAHSIAGRNIMMGAEATLITITIINFGIAFAVGALGVLSSIQTAILAILAVITTFLGSLWALGATLAIYMPLIPYMIFTMAAIGWMLTVVEAVIAGPIIALGLVTPSGDELGKVEHSLMLLANIFLRPMLMIFGFLLASRVYKAAVTLVGFGMADVFRTIHVFTLFSSVPIMFLYATFIISITNVCFSLIYAVPDKILTWMGGKGESTNSDISEVKSASSGMAKSVGGDLGAGGAAAANKGMEIGKAKGGGGGKQIGPVDKNGKF